MHPDLPKLLEVQRNDRRLAELDTRRDAIAAERASLDSLLERGRSEVANAERALSDAMTRRDEAEQILQTQRQAHDRRREALDRERNPRVAAQLLADVELGRTILAQEESDWIRLADEVTGKTTVCTSATERLSSAEAEQAGARAVLDQRDTEVATEHEQAAAEREAAASHLDRALRIRYDRLRKSRQQEILVPANDATCTSCYTAIPRSRIGKLQSEGILIDGCEMCGAIIYLPDAVA